jgi:acyl carrier protein
VPVGVAGELHLAGEILARGYLGRADLTAERFVPSPFSDSEHPGERLYRSGDLVRHLPDGAIDFVGRVDDQVKIRGFRIEPGEIASVLGRHPAVRDAAVVALASPGSKDWRLVAYLVANENENPAATELRDFLKAHLPAYMVPADYVTMENFPITATGKIDRNALPRPEAQVAAEHAPPETETEEILAGFWRDLLGRDPVGIYDDFFDLGGHSLLAPQLMSSIAQVFEIELPLRVLFEAPTVAQLAVALEAAILAQIESLDDEEAGEWLEAG